MGEEIKSEEFSMNDFDLKSIYEHHPRSAIISALTMEDDFFIVPVRSIDIRVDEKDKKYTYILNFFGENTNPMEISVIIDTKEDLKQVKNIIKKPQYAYALCYASKEDEENGKIRTEIGYSRKSGLMEELYDRVVRYGLWYKKIFDSQALNEFMNEYQLKTQEMAYRSMKDKEFRFKIKRDFGIDMPEDYEFIINKPKRKNS